MSNRDSLGFGEMVPQDVVDIFAQEKQGKASRKKRSRSLGRALGWLKGRKKKDQGAERQNAGLSPALDLAHPAGHKGGHHKSGKHANAHGNSHAVPKRDSDDDKTLAPPLFQENVFIESSSRPKYLEDLHTEAMEGLKMMQQEETSPGVEYQDNMSTISALSIQTDGEGGGFTTDSTMPDSSSVVSVQSSVSTKSSRSGLTRQGSTFRPLNSGKKSEKSKSRKRQRKTVAGIPQHVRQELGLDRVGWMMPPKLDEEQHYNGESDYSTTSDRTLGPDSPDGPATSPESLNNVHPLSKEKVALLNASHAGLRDNLALLHHLDPGLAPEQRPLAAPWTTSASSLQQELPSPVITMSPQAAYMSKIIPNAVLPPSIDVVEISRGRSRNSVRTVSKGSLVLSSPAPSRASSRASSKASTITSASRHNLPNMSDSNWSNSDSSETLVSDSSTISNRSTPSQRRSQNGDAHEDKVSLRSNGKINVKGVDPKRDGQFGRSLSVMKAKRAPPPPSRSYSLHNKMKRRSRDLAEVRVLPGELSLQSVSAQGEEAREDKPGVESPGYQADTSSLEDLTGPGTKKQAVLHENKLNVTSPSSGYSSQDVASPQPPKLPLSSSPKHKKGLLAKLQSLFPSSASPAPAAPPAAASGSTQPDAVDTVSPSVQALRELFNIPRHPKVHAPPPPPPEVWAHSKRSFELLLGPPAPENVYAIIKKNPKDRRQQRPSPATAERKQTAESVNGSLHVQEAKKVPESGVPMAEIQKENNERLTPKVELKESGDEKVRGSDILNGMLAKAVEKRKERLAARREDESKKASIQTPNAETLPPISLARFSPSPSPDVGRRPVPPPVAVVSPETSWPPPPPPLAQVSPPDELDFTLPPPPLFAEGAAVLPVQVPAGDASQAVAPPPLNIPPPPSYTAPPPPAAVSPLLMNKSHHSPKTNALPVIQEAVSPPPAPPPPVTFSPSPGDPPTTLVTVVSRPVLDVSALPPETIPPPPPQSFSMTLPPQSIPPPPPLPPQASQLKVTVPPSDSVLRPPESIPPPPPVERLHQAAAPPPSVASVLVAPAPETLPPPPMMTAVPQSNQHQPTANQSQEKTPAPVVPEGSSSMVTPSLLQMVKLRSVNSSPEPPKAEVTMRKKLPTSSPSGEAPQKPIRRSLIVTSPTSTSPPVIVTPQPPPPASQSAAITSAPSSTVESSVEVPPPVAIAASVVAPPASSTVMTVESAPAPAPAPPSVEAPSTTAITIDSSMEKSPPAAAEITPVVAPPVSSTVAAVETSPPVTTAVEAQSASTIDSVEKSPPATAAAPSAGDPPASSSPAVSSTETSPPPTTVDVTVEVPPVSPPTVKSLEISPPAPPTVSASPASASPVDSVEASPPVSAPPASTSPVVSVETSPPVSAPPESAPPVVSVETSPPVSAPPESAPPVVSVETSPPVSAPPASSSPAVSVDTSPPVITAVPDAAPPSSTATPPMEKSPPTTTVVPPIVVSPSSSTTVVSPVKKSPSATSAAPSMNLQEAIRLRTAARSKEAPASRLSLHSPTSPKDFRTSPTSTASFIFSKSNKKVVIETRPKSEVKGDAEKSPQLSPVAKAVCETQPLKKEVKVPPPVAKKPKSAGKEAEASEGAESAAQRGMVRDAAEKTNGTAGSVEGGGTPAS